MNFKTTVTDKYFLKDTIKKAIEEKYNGDVSLITKPESLSASSWNAMKKGVISHRYMTIGMFIVWCNILNIDVEMTVKSK